MLSQTKEEAILKAQQFDLIYAQSGYLCTIIPYAPHVGSSRQDMSGESHAINGVIESITHHPHLYMTSTSMPPHFSTTPSVSQLGYAPYFLCVASQSKATPSYTYPT